MSLRLRLNLLHAALLAIALGSIITAMLLDAGPRARAEYAGMMQLARSHVERSLASLPNAPDPEAGLVRLLGDIGHLRHIRISWQPAGAERAMKELEPQGRAAAAATRGWASILLPAQPEPLRTALDITGGPRGDIVIEAAPGDEVAEIWEAVGTIAFRGVVLALALLGLSSLLIQRALEPIHAIGDVLGRLGRGDLAARVPEAGPPELSSICRALNGLAVTLQEAHDRNRKLAREMVGVRDRERRDLAHELHDELGPYLFSARANGAALQDAIGTSAPDGPRIRQLGDAILDQLERIQSVNRRILTQLSPPGLKELGLAASLRALVAGWQAQRQDLHIGIETTDRVEGLGETEALTIYRIVQEGLTNALRHGMADRISVLVKRETSASGAGEGQETIVVRVLDNGRGLGPEARPGFGMLGMQERVWALGGTLELVGRHDGGARLEARFPAQSDAPRRADTD